MKPMLKIGGHDYTKWVAEGGLTPTDSDVDSSKSGRNTLDALMVRNKIGAKMKWNVTLMDIPEEVAALAISLAEGNDYLTGQVITLDGGWL